MEGLKLRCPATRAAASCAAAPCRWGRLLETRCSYWDAARTTRRTQGRDISVTRTTANATSSTAHFSALLIGHLLRAHADANRRERGELTALLVEREAGEHLVHHLVHGGTRVLDRLLV